MFEFVSKEGMTAVAVVLALVAGVIYLCNAIWGRGKPHFVTWFVLGVITSMAFMVQLQAGERIGAIPLGLAALLNFCNSIVGLIKDNREYGWRLPFTRTDWLCGVLALVALYFWRLAGSPVMAVWLLTFASLSAFAPTIRRAWHQPWGETLIKYQITTVRYVLTVAALQSHSFLTAFYPAVWIGVNAAVVVLLLGRRRYVPQPIREARRTRRSVAAEPRPQEG